MDLPGIPPFRNKEITTGGDEPSFHLMNPTASMIDPSAAVSVDPPFLQQNPSNSCINHLPYDKSPKFWHHSIDSLLSCGSRCEIDMTSKKPASPSPISPTLPGHYSPTSSTTTSPSILLNAMSQSNVSLVGPSTDQAFSSSSLTPLPLSLTYPSSSDNDCLSRSMEKGNCFNTSDNNTATLSTTSFQPLSSDSTISHQAKVFSDTVLPDSIGHLHFEPSEHQASGRNCLNNEDHTLTAAGVNRDSINIFTESSLNQRVPSPTAAPIPSKNGSNQRRGAMSKSSNSRKGTVHQVPRRPRKKSNVTDSAKSDNSVINSSIASDEQLNKCKSSLLPGDMFSAVSSGCSDMNFVEPAAVQNRHPLSVEATNCDNPTIISSSHNSSVQPMAGNPSAPIILPSLNFSSIIAHNPAIANSFMTAMAAMVNNLSAASASAANAATVNENFKTGCVPDQCGTISPHLFGALLQSIAATSVHNSTFGSTQSYPIANSSGPHVEQMFLERFPWLLQQLSQSAASSATTDKSIDQTGPYGFGAALPFLSASLPSPTSFAMPFNYPIVPYTSSNINNVDGRPVDRHPSLHCDGNITDPSCNAAQVCQPSSFIPQIDMLSYLNETASSNNIPTPDLISAAMMSSSTIMHAHNTSYCSDSQIPSTAFESQMANNLVTSTGDSNLSSPVKGSWDSSVSKSKGGSKSVEAVVEKLINMNREQQKTQEYIDDQIKGKNTQQYNYDPCTESNVPYEIPDPYSVQSNPSAPPSRMDTSKTGRRSMTRRRSTLISDKIASSTSLNFTTDDPFSAADNVFSKTHRVMTSSGNAPAPTVSSNLIPFATSSTTTSLMNAAVKRRRKPDEPEEALIRYPLTLGWIRKTHVRLVTKTGVRGDVVYYSPDGRKLKSFQEIDRYLLRCGPCNLTRQHFTFSSKLLVGIFVLHHREESGGAIESNEISEDEIVNQIRQYNPEFQKSFQPPSAVSTLDRSVSKSPSEDIPTHVPGTELINPPSHSHSLSSCYPPQYYSAPATGIPGDMTNCDISISSDPLCCALMHGASESGMNTPRQSISEIFTENVLRNQKEIIANPSNSADTLVNSMCVEPKSIKSKRTCRQNCRRIFQGVGFLRQRHQRAVETATTNEMKNTIEDMLIKDARTLPDLPRVPEVRVSSRSFANCLAVLEFIHTFSKTLGICVSEIPSLNDLQQSLLSTDIPERNRACSSTFYRIVRLLLHFCLLEHLVQGRKSYIIGNQKFTEASLSITRIDEILRLYMEEHSFSTTLVKELSEKSIFEMEAGQKIHILYYLCNELLGSKVIIECMDNNIAKLAYLRRQKWEMECLIRRMRSNLSKSEQAEDSVDDNLSTNTVTGSSGPYKHPVNVNYQPNPYEPREQTTRPQSRQSLSPSKSYLMEQQMDLSKTIESYHDQQVAAQHEPDDNHSNDRNSLHSSLDESHIKDFDQTISKSQQDVLVEPCNRHCLSNENGDVCVDTTHRDGFVDETNLDSLGEMTMVNSSGECGLSIKNSSSIIEQGKPLSVNDSEQRITQMQQQCEDIKRSIVKRTHLLRCAQLGQDRYKRRYWLFTRLGAIYVEGGDVDNEFEYSTSSSIIPVDPYSDYWTSSQSNLNESAVQEIQGTDHSMNCFVPNTIDASILLEDQKEENILSRLSSNSTDNTSNSQGHQDPLCCANDYSDLPLNLTIPGRIRLWISSIPSCVCQIIKKNHKFIESLEQVNWTSYLETDKSPSETTAIGKCLQFVKSYLSQIEKDALPEVKAILQHQKIQEIPIEFRQGWWCIADIQILRNLLLNLTRRGIREKHLYHVLTKNVDQIDMTFQNACSSDSLNDDEVAGVDGYCNPIDIEYEHSTVRTGSPISSDIKCNLTIDQHHPNAYLSSDIVFNEGCDDDANLSVMALLENLYTMEDRVLSSSLQIHGNLYESRYLMTTTTKGDSHRNVNWMSVACNRLISLEKSIERRYLREPFVKTMSEANRLIGSTSVSEINEVTTELTEWRKAVIESTDTISLSRLLDKLDRHICWEKSIMRVVCQICNRDEHEDQLLLCDACDRGHHTYCFRPPISSIPDGDWFCFCCLSKSQNQFLCFICGGSASTDYAKSMDRQWSPSSIDRNDGGNTRYGGGQRSSSLNLVQDDNKGNQYSSLRMCQRCEKHFHTDCHPSAYIDDELDQGICLCLVCRETSSTSNNLLSCRMESLQPTLKRPLSEQVASSDPDNDSQCTVKFEKPNLIKTEIDNEFDKNQICEKSSNRRSSYDADVKPPDLKKPLLDLRCDDDHEADGRSLSSSSDNQDTPSVRHNTLVCDMKHWPELDVVEVVVSDKKDEELDNHDQTKVKRMRLCTKSGSTTDDQMSTTAIQFKCKQIVNSLFKHPSSWPFRDSVDEKVHPEYYKIIEHPMDLQIVKEKVYSNRYSSLMEFAGDVRLIFSNCHFYNEDESPVGQAGVEMSTYFEVLYGDTTKTT